MTPINPSVPTATPAEFTAGMTDAAHAALWQEWDVYLRRIAIFNDVQLRQAATDAATKHAQAQADTAVAMQASVVAQQAMAAVMAQPALATPWTLPTEAQLVQWILSSGTTTLAAAQTAARAFRAAYKPATPFPTGAST